MPPKQRGGKRARHATGHTQHPTTQSDDENIEIHDEKREEFEKFVCSTLSKLVEGQQQLEATLAASIEHNSARIAELEDGGARLDKSVGVLKSEVEMLKGQLSRMRGDINKQERFSRRNTFRAVGVPRSVNENGPDNILNILKSDFGMETNPPQIERAHRDGQDRDGKPAHILVNLLSYQDKVKIMKSCRRALEGSQMFIIDDLTAEDLQEKKRWKKEVKTLYDQGTKLRFFAGRWRASNGQAFSFPDEQ